MQAWQGQFIVEMVRKVYTKGNKSGNKIYCQSSAESVPIGLDKRDIHGNLDTSKLTLDDYFDAIQPALWTRIFASKKKLTKMSDRNDMAAASMVKRGDVHKKISGQSLYEAGRTIFLATDGSLASGNCGEMAMVASYLAIFAFLADPKEVWYGSITGRGDHAFCLVGPKPTETTVRKMASLSLVIDPWLNISCTAAMYCDVAAAKLKKWHQEGKRVAFTGSMGLGWYCPGGEYSDRFMTEPLQFELAKP